MSALALCKDRCESRYWKSKAFACANGGSLEVTKGLESQLLWSGPLSHTPVIKQVTLLLADTASMTKLLCRA